MKRSPLSSTTTSGARLMDQGIHFFQGFDLTFNYEDSFLATMVAGGHAVVVGDGVGMGVHSPGRAAVRQPPLGRHRAARRRPGGHAAARHLTGSPWDGGILGLADRRTGSC
ncbi:hypothetical protein ACXDF8_08760 [Mycolicibacterium sp. CBM1]